MRALQIAIAASALSFAGSALACDFNFPGELEISANPGDETPPSAPRAQLLDIQRGNDWGGDDSGCRNTETSCDGTAYLLLDLASTDNLSATEGIGFRVEDANGHASTNDRVLVLQGGQLMVFFGTDDGQDDLSFELRITAVDQAGNESLPTLLSAKSPGDSRCQLARGIPSGVLYTLALFTLMSWRRARRAA
jgi:hypothetical protein